MLIKFNIHYLQFFLLLLSQTSIYCKYIRPPKTHFRTKRSVVEKKLNPNVDTTSGVVVKNFSYDVDSDGKGNIISPSFEIYTDDSDIENDDDDDDFY